VFFLKECLALLGEKRLPLLFLVTVPLTVFFRTCEFTDKMKCIKW